MGSIKKSAKKKNTQLRNEAWNEGYTSSKKVFEEGNNTTSDQVRETISGLIEVPLNLENVDEVYKRIDGFSHGLLEIIFRS